MVEHLPEFIDPLVLAEKRRQFKGSLPLTKMSRLHDVLLERDGAVDFELRFEKDGKIAAVSGIVQAALVLQCQCCLEAIAWPVKTRVKLAVVSSIDEADLLPESYEPLLLEGETMPLADIIQEELLLAIPAIPQHDNCAPALPPSQRKEAVSEAPKRPNPFAILAELKKSN
jgi:uncharacterized protein